MIIESVQGLDKITREQGVYTTQPLWVLREATYAELVYSGRENWQQLGVYDDVVGLSIEINIDGKWEVLAGCTTDAKEKRNRDGSVAESTSVRGRLPQVIIPQPQIRGVVRQYGICNAELTLVFYDDPIPVGYTQEHHSVTYDSDNEATANNATSVTIGAFAVANNANRLMVVGVASYDGTAGDSAVSSVSHNGSTTGWASVITDTGPGAAINRASIWRKIAPSVVSATVVVTMGGTCDEIGANACSLYDVDQTTPLGTAVTAEGTATTVTVNAASEATGMVYDAVYFWGGSFSSGWTATVGASQVQRANGLISGSVEARYLMSTEPGATTTTMSWTSTGTSASREWVQVAVPIKVAAGGTLYTTTIAGVVTPSGVLVKSVNKKVSGIITPTGVLVKQVNKRISGVITPVGVLVKRVGKVLSGAVTPVGVVTVALRKAVILAGTLGMTGVLVKRVNKVLTGNVTPVGSLSKQVNKVLSGVLTPVGVVSKRVNKILSAALSLVGDVSSVFISGGGIVYTVTLNAALAMTGVLSKTVNKVLTGSVTPTGVVVKQVNKVLVGTVTPVGTLVKVVSKVLSGVLTPTGSVINAARFSVILSGALAITGSLRKQVNKTLQGSLAVSGNLVKRVNKNISGGLVPVGVLVKRVNKVLGGTVTPVGTLVRSYIRSVTLSGVLGIVGSLTSSFIAGTGVVLKDSLYPWFRRKNRR